MKGPVFVVGCARSGTTLLYHALVSSGAFLDYRAETHFYDKLAPAYGPFDSRSNRIRFFEAWKGSEAFRRFGLSPDRVRPAVVEECRTAGDILRTVFGAAAEEQGRGRWAECTPLHLLSMDAIKCDLPDATFIHVIRDGRDVALSLDKVGWLSPLPWDRGAELLVGAWVWEWQIHRGLSMGRELSDAYHEVRFESLVREPQQTLDRVAEWIEHPLDWGEIQDDAVGVLARPNSAFGEEEDPAAGSFNPVGRWRRQCSERELAALDVTIGETLDQLGYPQPDVQSVPAGARIALLGRKRVYQAKRELQFRLKQNDFLSRMFTDPELEHV